MKKILTSLLMMAATLVASAQNFTVTAFGNQPVANGDNVKCGWTQNLGFANIYNPELMVHLQKNATITVTANGAPVDGVNAQFCGITGQCVQLTGTPVTRSGKYSAGDAVKLEVDVMMKKVIRPLPVEVTVTDGLDVIKFTVTFVADEQTSIAEVGNGGNWLKVNGRTLAYGVEGSSQLTLYTIAGQTALSRSVSGNGSISLSGVPAGVYIYRLADKTGKIVVK